jgi:hypothetical protein
VRALDGEASDGPADQDGDETERGDTGNDAWV